MLKTNKQTNKQTAPKNLKKKTKVNFKIIVIGFGMKIPCDVFGVILPRCTMYDIFA